LPPSLTTVVVEHRGLRRNARQGGMHRKQTWAAVMAGSASLHSRSPSTPEAEIIDLRSRWPGDQGCVLVSVRKTGRLLLAQDVVRVGGFPAGAWRRSQGVAEMPRRSAHAGSLRADPRDEWRGTDDHFVAAVKVLVGWLTDIYSAACGRFS